MLGEYQPSKQTQEGVISLNQAKYNYRKEDQAVHLLNTAKQSTHTCNIAPLQDINELEVAALLFGWVWIVASGIENIVAGSPRGSHL